MGWEIFSMGWGVGFSKWPKRVSDFSVKNQGEHWTFFHGGSQGKIGVQRGCFQLQKNMSGGAGQF